MPAPLRILHVVPTYLPAVRYGGPIHSVHGLCKALAARGHDVHVFTTNVDGHGSSDVPLGQPVSVEGVIVWYFPTRLLRRLYWSPPMRKALRRYVPDFDLLHLHSVFLWPTWAAARAAQRAAVPYVLAPRGMLVPDLVSRKSQWLKTAWIRLIEQRNLDDAAALHVTTTKEAEEAARLGLRLPPVVCIPNGVDVEQLRSDVSSPSSCSQLPQPFVLFLGRINWKKGLDRLIPAMQHVPAVHLIVAGNDDDGAQPRLQALAREAGMSERISFLGHVDGAAKRQLLQAAQVLALPSYSENFGNVVLEAMACAVPVIVTPEVGLAETVREAGAGIVARGEPEVFGAAIRSLLEDEPLRQAMGRRGRELASSRFAWDAVAQQMERAYFQILSGSAPEVRR